MNLLREKLRAQGHHLAQFGGGSSSSTASTTNQTDNRRTIGAGGISAEGSTVNVLDGGAINAAFGFSGDVVGESFNFAKTAQSAALDSLNTTSNLVKDAYADAKGRGALTDKILIGAIATAGLVAVMALKGKT